MPSLPLATAFTDSAITEAGFKSAITDQREFLAGLLDTSGNQIDALRKLGVLGSDTSAKSGAYTVVAADRGVTFLCTGTFTLSLTAAATLGDGFTFAVINIGTGTITIDPNSTELIDGASTDSIAAGSWAIVTCTGSAFHTMGAVPATGALIGYQVFTASGTYTKATNNPSFVIVEVVGGGGGSGSFSSNSTGSGGTGGTSSFGSKVSATGGAGSISSVSAATAGGTGGLGSNGDLNIRGGAGIGNMDSGANGGNSFFGGGGLYLNAASANTGGGAGGNFRVGGGGAGGYAIKKILASSLAASETVTVGNGGAGNTSGLNDGYTGGSGLVIVWEYK